MPTLGGSGCPRAKHLPRAEGVLGAEAGVVGGHGIFQSLPLTSLVTVSIASLAIMLCVGVHHMLSHT